MAIDNDYPQIKARYHAAAKSTWDGFMAWRGGNDINRALDDLCHELQGKIPDIKKRHNRTRLYGMALSLFSPFISKKFCTLILLLLETTLIKSSKNRFVDFIEFGLCQELSIGDFIYVTRPKTSHKTASKKPLLHLSKNLMAGVLKYIKYAWRSGNTKLFIEDRLLYEFIHNEAYCKSVSQTVLKLAKIKRIAISEYAVDASLHFLKDHFSTLIDIIPDKHKVGIGFAKMFKVLLGVLLYKLAHLAKNANGMAITMGDDEVINLVKTAYYWGLTYPLIDDIIDSDILTPNEKSHYFELLTALFSNTDGHLHSALPSKHPFIAYIVASLQGLKAITPYHDNRETYLTILLALESHMADYQSGHADAMPINIIMKSGLVRVVTALLAGVPVSEACLKNMLLMAFYNQEEDDMRDVLEDLDKHNPTPFVRYILNGDIENPFYLYIQYMYYIDHLANHDRGIKDLLMLEFLEMIKNINTNYGHFAGHFLGSHEGLKDTLGTLNRYSDGIGHFHLENVFVPYLVDCVEYFIRNKKMA